MIHARGPIPPRFLAATTRVKVQWWNVTMGKEASHKAVDFWDARYTRDMRDEMLFLKTLFNSFALRLFVTMYYVI